jgi:hypothetical protein
MSGRNNLRHVFANRSLPMFKETLQLSFSFKLCHLTSTGRHRSAHPIIQSLWLDVDQRLTLQQANECEVRQRSTRHVKGDAYGPATATTVYDVGLLPFRRCGQRLSRLMCGWASAMARDKAYGDRN